LVFKVLCSVDGNAVFHNAAFTALEKFNLRMLNKRFLFACVSANFATRLLRLFRLHLAATFECIQRLSLLLFLPLDLLLRCLPYHCTTLLLLDTFLGVGRSWR